MQSYNKKYSNRKDSSKRPANQDESNDSDLSRESNKQEVEFKGGLLTALSVQKGNPDRLSLFVDEEFAFGIRREVAYMHGLKKGMEVSVDFLIAVWRDEEGFRAKDLALKYLGFKARTRKQMADYLAGKEFDEVVVAATISWLEGYGYLDDETFAKQWVENRMRHKPRGRSMLRWELQQKGIASEQIGEALQDVDGEAQVEAAVLALEKKIGRKQLEWTPDDKRKLAAFLGRRGFGSGTVYEALRRYRAAANLDND